MSGQREKWDGLGPPGQPDPPDASLITDDPPVRAPERRNGHAQGRGRSRPAEPDSTLGEGTSQALPRHAPSVFDPVPRPERGRSLFDPGPLPERGPAAAAGSGEPAHRPMAGQATAAAPAPGEDLPRAAAAAPPAADPASASEPAPASASASASEQAGAVSAGTGDGTATLGPGGAEPGWGPAPDSARLAEMPANRVAGRAAGRAAPEPRRPADQPAWYADPADLTPEPGSWADLRQRLERLPYGHPSSPYHVDGERKPPPPRLKHLELAPPARDRGSELDRPAHPDPGPPDQGLPLPATAPADPPSPPPPADRSQPPGRSRPAARSQPADRPYPADRSQPAGHGYGSASPGTAHSNPPWPQPRFTPAAANGGLPEAGPAQAAGPAPDRGAADISGPPAVAPASSLAAGGWDPQPPFAPAAASDQGQPSGSALTAASSAWSAPAMADAGHSGRPTPTFTPAADSVQQAAGSAISSPLTDAERGTQPMRRRPSFTPADATDRSAEAVSGLAAAGSPPARRLASDPTQSRSPATADRARQPDGSGALPPAGSDAGTDSSRGSGTDLRDRPAGGERERSSSAHTARSAPVARGPGFNPAGTPPRLAADGTWAWGPAKLAPDQVRIADDSYDRFRAAEGRDLFGSYVGSGLTAKLRQIEERLDDGSLDPHTEVHALLDIDVFRARFADMLRRHPDRSPELLASRVPGALSYAFIFDVDHYADGILTVQDALEAQGFELQARKNSWSSASNRCVYTMWHDPLSELPFEVQFHTGASHEAQQLARTSASLISDPRIPADEAASLRSDLASAWAAVPSPPRNAEISDYRRYGTSVPRR